MVHSPRLREESAEATVGLSVPELVRNYTGLTFFGTRSFWTPSFSERNRLAFMEIVEGATLDALLSGRKGPCRPQP